MDGQSGEVVYTSIHREASPLLRMRSHDLMQVFTDPCPCGRTSFRFRILGRSDDMFIVKGVNVFPLAIQATLLGLAPRVTGEFQVVIDRPPPIDYPVPLSVEVARDVPAEGDDRARARSRRAPPGGPQLHRGRARRSGRLHRHRGQDPPRHPQLSRGGPLMAVVDVEIRGDVALITLGRPEKLNAINDEMLDGLLEAIETVAASEVVGAAVLTGRGRAFSAGGDIAAMDGMDEMRPSRRPSGATCGYPPRFAPVRSRSSRPSTAMPSRAASNSP